MPGYKADNTCAQKLPVKECPLVALQRPSNSRIVCKDSMGATMLKQSCVQNAMAWYGILELCVVCSFFVILTDPKRVL